MADANVHGVFIVDKPKGPTSHDVVTRVRRLVKSRAVGHAGTLDPMATGVLVVAVGEATKLVPWLTAADKAYRATIHLGTATNTLDAEGDVTERAPIPSDVRGWALAGGGAAARSASTGPGDAAASARVAAAFDAERARREQVPPAFSAIKIDGVRAHERARAGEDVALAARSVEVRRLELIAVRANPAVTAAHGGETRDAGEPCGVELDVLVEAAKGYFVRALARDLAAGLGTVGHLTALRRIRSGAFCIEDATALDALAATHLRSLDDAAKIAMPITVLDDDGVRAAAFGQRVAAAQMTDPHRFPSAWLDRAGHLVAVGECLEDGTGKVLRGFPRT